MASLKVCGSLADGDKRHVRPENSTCCDCNKGWTGVNCNVCENNDSCAALIPPYSPGKLLVQISNPQKNRSEAVCYKGGFAVNRNYQMCNRGKERRKNSPPKFFKVVLILNDAHSTTFYNNNNYIKDRKILDMLPGRLPQVSFMCDIPTSTLPYMGNKQSFYSTTLVLRMVFL
ncbi:hypothetical protein BY996DRAFT_8460425 [Phakopsora pachyrhizi]|nr:hypothetical protein BY996DRAFT_8460425 [Phakopsora pachyrhizi]